MKHVCGNTPLKPICELVGIAKLKRSIGTCAGNAKHIMRRRAAAHCGTTQVADLQFVADDAYHIGRL